MTFNTRDIRTMLLALTNNEQWMREVFGNPYLSPKQIATQFNISRTTLTNWEELKLLNPIKTPGGHRRYLQSEVEALLYKEKEKGKI